MAGRFFSNIISSRRSSAHSVENSNPAPKETLPWLILAPYLNNHEVSLVEPCEGRTWPLPPLRNIEGKVWCVGSNDGWLVVCCKLDLLLLDPVTGEKIPLPSFYPQPEIAGRDLPCVCKVILSASPRPGTSRRSIVAMAIASGGNVAYAKIKDRKWTEVRTAPTYSVRDIAYNNGTLFVLSSGPIRDNRGKYRQSKLLTLDFNVNGSKPEFSWKDYIDLLEEGTINLVSSPTGDLLLVLGMKPDSDSWRDCRRFRVMAYRPGSGCMWAEGEDFGSWSFLVDMLQCTMHPAGDGSAAGGGLRGNCVYFARNLDVKVLDIRPNYDTALRSMELVNLQLTVPLWFRPSLTTGK